MEFSHFFPLWPPSINHTWRNGCAGRNPFLSPDVRKFRRDMSTEIMVARYQRQMPRGRLEGPVAVSMLFYPPTAQRRDLDNLPKAVFDALTHALVWSDDSQVRRMELEMCEPCPKDGGFWMCLKTLS